MIRWMVALIANLLEGQPRFSLRRVPTHIAAVAPAAAAVADASLSAATKTEVTKIL